jgi:hypothetical protein
MYNCYANIGTTGITLYSHTAAGGLNLLWCNISNSGNSSTASNNSASSVNWQWCNCDIPVSTSGTGSIGIYNSIFDHLGNNFTNLTLNSSGALVSQSSTFISGTATAITVTSGSLSLSNSVVNSSNTNAISGAGTLAYQGISFISSAKISTTTQTGGTLPGGVAQAPSAGFLGEQIRATVSNVSPVSISNNTQTNLTSISLTAGIWDVTAIIAYTGLTTATRIVSSISTTSATLGATNGDNRCDYPIASTTNSDASATCPAYRLTLTSTTTVYAVGYASYTVGTGVMYGRISATRVG